MPTPIALSPVGPTLSPIVAGTMTWGEWGADLDTAAMADLIEHCRASGITTFDHADIYGHYSTEESFGKALAELGSRARDGIQLVSKAGIRLVTKRRPDNRLKSYDTSKDYLIESCERSLRNLKTDYLDLFLIHRPNPLLVPEEVAAAVDALKQSGKIREFGVSNFKPHQFAALGSVVPLVTNQVEYNPLHAEPLFDGTLDQALHLGCHPMIWSPLGGSKYFAHEGTAVLRLRDVVRQLSEKYGDVGEDVILLAWCLRHPSRPVPVVGTTKAERLTRALRALDLELDPQDYFAILEAGRGREVA